VKIRSSRQEEIQATRKLHVFLDQHRIVVGVKGFDRVETGGGQGGNSWAEPALARMRNGGDPAGLVNDLDHDFDGGTFAGDEAGTAWYEPAIERLLCTGHVSRLDHCSRHLRSSDRAAVVAAASIEDRLDVDSDAVRGKTCSYRLDAVDSDGALGLEQRGKTLVARIEQIPKDVEVAACLDRSDLDPRHGVDAKPPRFRLDFSGGRGGVVIGDGHHRHAAERRPLDQLLRRAPPVGRRRVEVKIDAAPRGRHQRAARVAAEPCRTGRRVRP